MCPPHPTLILDGADDIRPAGLSTPWPPLSRPPRRVVLPDVGHVPWLEAPAQFAAAVLDFLTSR
ncbi:alpha/beta fold hydrolase [Amycolatopsis sp. FDAARGOS 1241]|uniref:alpha/beta fold hydrolase n=1 Tax=Amycolatopsis sp. FDAARGOS 1241 TaxID=2778070 RepID=UPI001EF3BA36|nr:alpha/beta hydrolase [Amycolatopsis sp. FDAARGOS 1241]